MAIFFKTYDDISLPMRQTTTQDSSIAINKFLFSCIIYTL